MIWFVYYSDGSLKHPTMLLSKLGWKGLPNATHLPSCMAEGYWDWGVFRNHLSPEPRLLTIPLNCFPNCHSVSRLASWDFGDFTILPFLYFSL